MTFQNIELVVHDKAIMNQFLIDQNALNKVVSFNIAPHGHTELLAMTVNNSTYQIYQIVEVFDISNMQGANDWIAIQNDNDATVNIITHRNTMNDLYLLSTKYIY